ncbi:MAG: hypothetical protein AAGA60_28550 [Cyanobacteria bacterium P01_E01_bin.42]
MDSWEFLIQKKGTRSWLPLKRRRLKLEAGIYRIVAQSCRANVDVEIRVIHRTIDEVPPKRRSQKRICQTSKEGLMIAIPFTYIRPGFWEFRCTCDKMNEMQGKPWQEIVQLEIVPAKVAPSTQKQNTKSPQEKKSSEKVVRQVENQSSANQSAITSDATPRRRKRCDPASAQDASGVTPRRRKMQGNADQERERAPRQTQGNAHQDSHQSPVKKGAEQSNVEGVEEAIAAKKVEITEKQDKTIPSHQTQVSVARQSAIATNLEKIEETISRKSKPNPTINNQQPATNNQQQIENDAHSLLEQSILSLEQILQQVSEPEPQPAIQSDTQPPIASEIEPQNYQPEESLSAFPLATKDDLEGIQFPNDLSISLLQDHFIRRKDEPLLISGHVNSFDLTQSSILDEGFEGVLRYELRDPHGTELLLDVRQPLSDATIPLVFNYLLDIPTEYDTRLILGEVILEVFIDRGDGSAKKTARLASQTFSITAGLDDLLEAIANPIETENPARVRPLDSGFSGEREGEVKPVKAEFLNLTKREIEARPFEPTEQQILPPKLSLSRTQKTTKVKNIDLPSFSSPPPKDSAYHSYDITSLSPEFLHSLKNDSLAEEKPSETENIISPVQSEENDRDREAIISDRDENKPIEEPDRSETPKIENNISESEEGEPSETEYIAEADEKEDEEKEDRSFQKVKMQGRFWKQINLMKVDEEVNEELVEWMQAHPMRSQNNEEKKNDLETTAQRLAEKAEVIQELAEEERRAALADIAEELELSNETSEAEILTKLAKEAEFLKKLAAEIDERKDRTPENQDDSEILRAPEIPSPDEENEAKVAEVTIDRTHHEFVVDDDEDEAEEALRTASLPKHDSSGLPYPVGIQSLATSRSIPFSPPPEKNRQEVTISEIQSEFSLQKSGNLIAEKQSALSSQLSQEIFVPTPILDVPEGELSAGELVLIRVRLPAYPGSIYVKLWVQDRETRQLLDGPRAFVDLTWNDEGELETLTQLIVPIASLSIRFEAIAIDVETQKESHKVTCDRTVIPPEFQQKSFEMI